MMTVDREFTDQECEDAVPDGYWQALERLFARAPRVVEEVDVEEIEVSW